MIKRDYKRLLQSNDFDDESQLEKVVRALEKHIRRARKQDVGEEEPDQVPTFPLVDIPDEELDEEQKKQKRQQKLAKSSYEARQRAKAEKDAEKARLAEEERRDVEARESDLGSWVSEKHAAREALLSRLKDRRRRKTDLTDRKSLASQMRMKSIANLASDTPAAKKRRRGGNPDADDTFGADDDDWAVYRSIGTGGTGEDDEDEDEELNRELKAIEAQLLAHDPDFEEHHTRDAQTDWSKSLLHAFLRGTRPFDPENQAEQNQMHLNVERIRVPEVVFEPSMAGLDQAGIVEIASDILLHRISNPTDRENILKDIFCTGGNTAFQGFDERLKKELIAVLPAGSNITVRKAGHATLDAWRGAAKWCGTLDQSAEWRRAIVTREEYLEKGSEYLKEHRMGNAFA
jgi:actin-related protein 5